MATRRQMRVHCSNVAAGVFAVVMPIACLIGACTNLEDGNDDRSDSGAVGAGTDGGAGVGGNGSISCTATGTGCLCIADDSQPGQLTVCSPTSVASGDAERGVCCVAESLCACIRYTCRSDPGSSFCQCGSVSSLGGVTLGDPAAACPTPATGQHCCFSQDNATCICARLDCADGETEVDNCSAVAAGACRSGEEIAACR